MWNDPTIPDDITDPMPSTPHDGSSSEALPKTDSCKASEKTECELTCGFGKVNGCYVTLNWKLKAVRGENANRFYLEGRTINCNCDDDDDCEEKK